MARGQTWSEEEVKALIEIWSDENILDLLVSTHKNNDVYKDISKKMETLGYSRTIDQCRSKVKKLRQQYIKTRDALRQSGNSPDEIDKCLYFDELDVFLGTKPTSSPQHVVESFDKGAIDIHEEATPSTSSAQQENKEGKSKLAHKRKRKGDRFEKALESYLEEKRKMDIEDNNRMKQEALSLQNVFKQQQEDSEKKFQMMMEHQMANSQLCLQSMANFISAAMPQTSAYQPWMPPPQYLVPQNQAMRIHSPPPVDEQEPHPSAMSSVLGDIRRDFFEL